MDNTTNDDRLKILQERLAQINQKTEKPTVQNPQKEEVIEVATEKAGETRERKDPSWGLEEKKPKSFRWIIYVIIIGLIAFVTTQESWKWDFSEILGNKKTSTEEIIVEKIKDFELEYKFEIEGNQLAIINSFEDESAAKTMVNDLTIKGFKCDYFFLPNKSNSTEEVYKVFIGPYESLEEVNQWKQNVNGEVEILNL